MMMPKLFNDVAYQIRNNDGLYSHGGRLPYMGKKGKVWKSKSAFNLHLNQFNDLPIIYGGCTIEESFKNDKGIQTNRHSLNEWFNEMKLAQKLARESERDKQYSSGYPSCDSCGHFKEHTSKPSYNGGTGLPFEARCEVKGYPCNEPDVVRHIQLVGCPPYIESKVKGNTRAHIEVRMWRRKNSELGS